jgi:uncharacterized protein YkwD
MAAVTIDGRPFGDVSFHFTEKRYQVPAVFDNLGPGDHVLTALVSQVRPSGSSGTNVTVDALKAPSPFSRDDAQRAGLDRSNFHRTAAGLTAIRPDRAIDLAAQAHADYDRRNPGGGHQETAGRPGYIGTRFWDRLAHFGYAQAHGEVMYWATQLTAAYAVDGWVASVYHRLPFMDYATTDLGYGEATGGNLTVSCIDFGFRGDVAPDRTLITTYPADGQRDVPTGWTGHESPEPLPGRTYPVGYPASLHIAQPGRDLAAAWRRPAPWAHGHLLAPFSNGAPFALPSPAGALEWRLGSAKLSDAAGRDVPAYVIDQASDSHKLLGPDTVFVIARSPLGANTTYTVRVTGTDSRDQAFDHRWSFTTGAARPSNLGPELSGHS